MTTTKVIKVGGALLEKPQQAASFMQALCGLHDKYNLVIVHGGGVLVESLLTQLGLKTVKRDGLRVTPYDQIDYIVGALAGTTNRKLCGFAQQAGLNPVGLSLGDGNMTRASVLDEALGAVGTVVPHSAKLLTELMSSDFLPVISCIGMSEQGQSLNVNADQAATAIAQLLQADLYLLSDVPGVLDGTKQLIGQLSAEFANSLIAQGTIKDGMLVKVQAAQHAADTLQRPVMIGSWLHPGELIAPAQPNQYGTAILPGAAQGELS